MTGKRRYPPKRIGGLFLGELLARAQGRLQDGQEAMQELRQ